MELLDKRESLHSDIYMGKDRFSGYTTSGKTKTFAKVQQLYIYKLLETCNITMEYTIICIHTQKYDTTKKMQLNYSGYTYTTL